MPKRPIRDLEALWRDLGAYDPKQRAEVLSKLEWKVRLRDDARELYKGPGGNLMTVEIEPGVSPAKLRNLRQAVIERDGRPAREKAAAGDETVDKLAGEDEEG